LYKYTPEEFKLRLLLFLNNTYTKNCIENERRKTVLIPVCKKCNRKDPKKLQRD
jgi:hypothetical protein